MPASPGEFTPSPSTDYAVVTPAAGGEDLADGLGDLAGSADDRAHDRPAATRPSPPSSTPALHARQRAARHARRSTADASRQPRPRATTIRLEGRMPSLGDRGDAPFFEHVGDFTDFRLIALELTAEGLGAAMAQRAFRPGCAAWLRRRWHRLLRQAASTAWPTIAPSRYPRLRFARNRYFTPTSVSARLALHLASPMYQFTCAPPAMDGHGLFRLRLRAGARRTRVRLALAEWGRRRELLHFNTNSATPTCARRSRDHRATAAIWSGHPTPCPDLQRIGLARLGEFAPGPRSSLARWTTARMRSCWLATKPTRSGRRSTRWPVAGWR